MSEKEIYELDVEIDSRDIDKTEKKLRALDKLLQQTQRRATVLGKTKVAPKVTLDDRISPKVTIIKDNLMKLDRMRVTPVATLIDHVSSKVGAIRSSLASLTQTRWQVAVGGVSWDTVIGKSFDDWMGSEGQSTMEKISSSIGTALGNGLRGFIMQALGLAEMPKEKKGIRLVNRVENIPDRMNEGSLYAEAGRLAGESFFQSFLGAIDAEQISNKLDTIKPNISDDNSFDFGGFMEDIGSQVLSGLILEGFTSGKFKSLGKSLFKWLGSGGAKTVSMGAEVGGGVAASAATTTAAEAVAGSTIAGPVSTVLLVDWVDKFSSDVADWIFGHEKGQPYTKPGLFKNPFKQEKYEDYRPGVLKRIVDFFQNKDKVSSGSYDPEKFNAVINEMYKKMYKIPIGDDVAETGTSIIPRTSISTNPYDLSILDQTPLYQKIIQSQENKSIETQPVQIPEEHIPSCLSQQDNPIQQVTINMSFPTGAVNLTIQKDEIDYEQIANLAGWQIADAVKYSMQNLKE